MPSRAIRLGDTYSYTMKDYDQFADIEQWQQIYSKIMDINPLDVIQFTIQKQKVYNEFGGKFIILNK